MQLGKVLVVGAGEAGKSTLIACLSPTAVNLEVEGRTVAMDHATLTRNGARLSLVGVPGQGRFEVVREALAVGARLALWVHRAGEPADVASARLVGNLAALGVPYLVIVNHHAGVVAGARDWRAPRGSHYVYSHPAPWCLPRRLHRVLLSAGVQLSPRCVRLQQWTPRLALRRVPIVEPQPRDSRDRVVWCP